MSFSQLFKQREMWTGFISLHKARNIDTISITVLTVSTTLHCSCIVLCVILCCNVDALKYHSMMRSRGEEVSYNPKQVQRSCYQFICCRTRYTLALECSPCPCSLCLPQLRATLLMLCHSSLTFCLIAWVHSAK